MTQYLITGRPVGRPVTTAEQIIQNREDLAVGTTVTLTLSAPDEALLEAVDAITPTGA